MMNFFLIFLGKLFMFSSQLTNRGNGSTWPGHIALALHKHFLSDMQKRNPDMKIIFVSGTNGKTTTSKMLTEILQANNKRVFHNESGANLLNGLASSFIRSADLSGGIPYDYFIFEIDENWLPRALEVVTPSAVVLLNLFRDQLDRYGELRMIAAKWQKVFAQAKGHYTLVLNADDPLIAYIGYTLRDTKYSLEYFGLPISSMKKGRILHGADSMYCPYCGEKLIYSKISYSHLGDWKCPSCGLSRPKTLPITLGELPLRGTYNMYNALAATTTASAFGVKDMVIQSSLQHTAPAFGRQERIAIGDKYAQIILSKNPTGSNQSMETVIEIAKNRPIVLFVLNDRIPDGTDVSWIWDTDLEEYVDKFGEVIISGDRTYDMALRAMYANHQKKNVIAIDNLKAAIDYGLSQIKSGETLYILPTYSAMLEVRKILTGKAIL